MYIYIHFPFALPSRPLMRSFLLCSLRQHLPIATLVLSLSHSRLLVPITAFSFSLSNFQFPAFCIPASFAHPTNFFTFLLIHRTGIHAFPFLLSHFCVCVPAFMLPLRHSGIPVPTSALMLSLMLLRSRFCVPAFTFLLLRSRLCIPL